MAPDPLASEPEARPCQAVRRLHEHRVWSNRQLLQACRGLSPDQLHQPMDIGRGSVMATLTHLYEAELIWLLALQGETEPPAPGETTLASLAQLEQAWNELDARWDAMLSTLQPEDLHRPVTKRSTSGPSAGAIRTTNRLDVLLHVCTHAQYTSAQAVNMLRKLDAGPLPDLQLMTLARTQPQ